jgi:hypothetical protein
MVFSIGMGEAVRRRTIPIIDRTAPLRGRLAEAGGVLALGTLSEAQVGYYLGKLGSATRYRLRRADIRELLRNLAQYRVRRLLSDYLGPLWSADYAAIWRSPAQSSSGQWHHDNVGHRVKLFAVLANASEVNGTEFILNSHRTRWRSFTGRLPPPAGRGQFVPQRRGDLLMFDTNVAHRGHYTAQERIILQLEFSSIFKSFFVLGQCGRFFRARFERSYGAAE